MTGVEVGLLSVVAILVLIYAGLYVPIALGLVSFIAVWILRNSTEAPIYLLTLAASNRDCKECTAQYAASRLPCTLANTDSPFWPVDATRTQNRPFAPH